ncbi:prepilin-type N-terminal cleavage/methylation domain-containing protein [Pectobacterium carotovorum]
MTKQQGFTLIELMIISCAKLRQSNELI